MFGSLQSLQPFLIAGSVLGIRLSKRHVSPLYWFAKYDCKSLCEGTNIPPQQLAFWDFWVEWKVSLLSCKLGKPELSAEINVLLMTW
eukprot:5444958-Amphidinium_carterae.1